MKGIIFLTKTLYILLFICLSNISVGAQNTTHRIDNTTFEFRNKIIPLNSYENLINNPKVIETYIFSTKIDNKQILDTLYDFHVLYDIPINKLINKLLDLNNEQYIFPRVIYTKDINPEVNLWGPHLQEVKMQFSFRLFEENYHYIIYKIPSMNNDGSFLIKWNLYDSLDEKFSFIYGSWYINEIYINNKKYSYVRNYIHYGMQNYKFYTKLAMNIGGSKNNITLLNSLKKAAE